MTFLEFFTRIRRHVYPEGAPSNLTDVHKNSVQDAMLDIQSRVRCFADRHCDRHAQTSTRFTCGAVVFEAPAGQVRKLSTVLADSACDEVTYDWVSPGDFFCILDGYKECVCTTETAGMGVLVVTTANAAGGPFAPCSHLEFPAASSYNNKPCRALSGLWTLYNELLWVYPSIESNELIIVRWRGLKKTWLDDDEVPTIFEGRDAMRAIESYVEADKHRKETRDMAAYRVAIAEYSRSLQILSTECIKHRMNITNPDGED